MKKRFCNLSCYSKVIIILTIILTVVNIVLIVKGKSIEASLQGSTGVVFDQASQTVSDFTDEYPTQIITIVVTLILFVVGGLICRFFIDPIKKLAVGLWEMASADGWVPILATIYDGISLCFLAKTITDILSVIH